MGQLYYLSIMNDYYLNSTFIYKNNLYKNGMWE